MTALLKCEHLQFGYEKSAFADSMDFELQSGEVVALMGENGCGKSTLLKTMVGQIPALDGSVSLLQNDSREELVCLKNMDARELAKRIALVRMSGITPDRMTVREFVSLGRSPYAGLFDGRSREDEKAIDDAISLLELKDFENRMVASLSDGERSRVFLAEAVAQQVKILLLDEPNAFLDIPRSHKLFKLLRMLAAERGMGIVVSTHSVEYAERYCDRIMVICDGNVGVEKACDAREKGLLDWTE
ncbi:ABC transporter ATP-binding protein [Fibrobacter sp. UWEL]|uniref:ABC transporter ATP-binding protein n=1 Tax=Fibrobacter sp. UWEL TaxID=1896209 RepID=UPI000919AD49|nr:ABC transporter ATP-binding protein [Fibrobacter sp. UWEL]SHK70570.1 iron complex transport system ATP-binding protein [Fibrobacter sp. UWEL]